MRRSLFISNKRIQKTEIPSLEIKDEDKTYTWSDGRSYIEGADGTKEWWLNGKRHREDGPAYEGADGTKEWWLNGKRHRVDGPAIERADGGKEWYLNGERQKSIGV